METISRASTNPQNGKPDRPFWKKKRWWGVAVVAVFLFWVYFVPRFPFGPLVLYSDLSDDVRSQKLEYSQLISKAEIDSGKTIYEPGHGPLPKPEAEPLDKFPGVRSCLVSSEQNREAPDLRLIDWDKLDDHWELDLCIWWIFASLGSPDLAKAWLEFHDFEVEVRSYVYGGNQKSTSVVGRRSFQTHQTIWPTTGVMRFQHLLRDYIRDEVIGSRWANDTELRSTGISHGIK